MDNTGCRYCERRHIGCHSNCTEYLEWKKQEEALKEKLRKDKEVSQAFMDHQFASINQMRKDGNGR